jgi:hypothetical protein
MLGTRAAAGERDYVYEEIAAALQRRIVVTWDARVRWHRCRAPTTGPEDIRDLVHSPVMAG